MSEKDVTTETIENELYEFFNDKMGNGVAPTIERIRRFKGTMATMDHGIVIDCVGGKQIALIIQVN